MIVVRFLKFHFLDYILMSFVDDGGDYYVT